MKLQFASDLHLEHIDDDIESIQFTDIIIPSAEILALVGDICTYDSLLLIPFIEWCSKNFQYVLWIPGNHEYYNNKGISMKQLDVIYREICSKFTNIHYMNNCTLVIDNIAFICTTLWSHIPDENRKRVRKELNDYKYIYFTEGVKITVNNVNDIYYNNK